MRDAAAASRKRKGRGRREVTPDDDDDEEDEDEDSAEEEVLCLSCLGTAPGPLWFAPQQRDCDPGSRLIRLLN